MRISRRISTPGPIRSRSSSISPRSRTLRRAVTRTTHAACSAPTGHSLPPIRTRFAGSRRPISKSTNIPPIIPMKWRSGTSKISSPRGSPNPRSRRSLDRWSTMTTRSVRRSSTSSASPRMSGSSSRCSSLQPIRRRLPSGSRSTFSRESSMSNAIEALDGRAERSPALSGLHENVWASGLVAAVAWGAAAVATIALPDVVPWGSDGLFAIIMASGALALVVLAFAVPRLGRFGEGWVHYGPWLIAIGVWLTLWELTTAKFGWLPKPFFSPPNGLLNVYVTEASRILICIGYTLRLWSIGFASGAVVGYALGVALGWSKSFSYWGMPILKLIGPVPATAWIPCTFFFFPTTFAASVFIVALSAGIPIAILTSSGVASVNRAYYDVGRNLGASEWYLVSKIAVPASLPHVFVGLFMALYYSFAVLVVAEMLGAKFGLGWYIQFETAYSGYANVYATLVIMALICAGIVKLLFVARDRLLGWQKGFI